MDHPVTLNCSLFHEWINLLPSLVHQEIPQAVTEVAKAPEAAAEKAKPQEAIKEVAQAPEAVKQAAPQTPEAEAIIPKTPDESLTKPAPAVERSPDTSTLRKGQVEDASRQKARQVMGSHFGHKFGSASQLDKEGFAVVQGLCFVELRTAMDPASDMMSIADRFASQRAAKAHCSL